MTRSTTQLGKTLGPFGWAMGILETAASASAAISLVQHWADIRLAEIPAQYVGYYRLMLRTLVDWIPLPFHWRIPQWYLDAFAINGIVAGAAVRSLYVVRYFQARLLALLIWASTLFVLGWLAGPWLVEWLNRFSLSSIREANARLEKWRAELDKLRVTHPGMALPAVTKQIQDDEAIVQRYGHFLAVRRAFRVGLALIVIATGVFFALNSLAPQPKSEGEVRPNHAFERTAASALRLLAVPSSLRSSAAAQRDRSAVWARRVAGPRRILVSRGS